MTWQTLIYDPSASYNANSVYKTVKPIFQLLINKEYDKIDFTPFEVDKINPQHLTSALRCTLQYKDKVIGWDHGLSITKQTIINQGIDLEMISGLE